jgi:cell shape-determining protein MreC
MAIHRQYVPKKNKTPALIILTLGVVVLLAVPVTRTAIRSSFAYVGTGIVRGTNGVSSWFENIFSTLRFKSTLVHENASLKDQISALNARLVERDVLSRENEELKATMGRATHMQFTLAAVLAKPPQSLYDTLVIDGGSNLGFVEGLIVYANGETPIGTIEEVLPTSSVVRMYSSSGEKTDARLDPSHVDITLEGRGGGTFSVQVPHDFSVSQGSLALGRDVSSHVIAILQKSTSDPRDSFQTLLFSSPVNMSELSFVQVQR